MYPKFIEVHDIGSDNIASVNIAHIVSFLDREINLSNSEFNMCIGVTESYDELKAMIKYAGCIIAKADPRLDKGELTKEDIKAMDIGEPIWNSNPRKWYLLYGWNDLEGGFLVTLHNLDEVLHYNQNDIQKYPLYRMRTAE